MQALSSIWLMTSAILSNIMFVSSPVAEFFKCSAVVTMAYSGLVPFSF